MANDIGANAAKRIALDGYQNLLGQQPRNVTVRKQGYTYIVEWHVGGDITPIKYHQCRIDSHDGTVKRIQ